MKNPTFYHDPLEIIERYLRDVIHDVLSHKCGPDWYENNKIGLGQEWVMKLDEKRKDDEGIQKPEVVSDFPIAYAEFSDLGKLLDKNKDQFKSIFKKWEEFWIHYKTCEKLRNIIKHHRDLSPTQYHLLIGIAGEIENKVNFWRIGTKLDIKRWEFQSKELVLTEGKSDDEILSESKSCINNWKNEFIDALKSIGENPGDFKVSNEGFQNEYKKQNIYMRIATDSTPIPKLKIKGKKYKGINGKLQITSGYRKLDDLLMAINKHYYYFAYDFVEKMDIDRLMKWSEERSGLNPRGTQKTNGELTVIEYSLLGGKIKIGVCKYSEANKQAGSRIFGSTENSQEGFYRAHNYLDHRKLIGFMIGSITPKTMMHLLRMAQIQKNE